MDERISVGVPGSRGGLWREEHHRQHARAFTIAHERAPGTEAEVQVPAEGEDKRLSSQLRTATATSHAAEAVIIDLGDVMICSRLTRTPLREAPTASTGIVRLAHARRRREQPPSLRESSLWLCER